MKKLFWRSVFWLLWPLVWIYSPWRVRARVLVVCGDEFLAVKSFFGAGKWQLPGGGIAIGETALAAAVRELYEETGVSVTEKEAKLLLQNSVCYESGLRMRYTIYVAQLSKKAPPVRQKNEISDVAWLQLSAPKKLLSTQVAQALHAYQQRGA